MTAISITAYLLLFAAVGFLFLFVALLLGRFLRPCKPGGEKSAIYECGEESQGTSRIRYDLRFYVVALVFLILDVEVAFFFPWATVFGKSAQLTAAADSKNAATVERIYREFGAAPVAAATETAALQYDNDSIRSDARGLSLAAMADMTVFFGVLLVGFAYVWWRGDLDWIRG